MIRSFLPVGQGAFYCERFKLNPDEKNFINVVYDCGSSNGAKCVEKQIKANFREGEIIHAVFISHLHNDHINGLEFLLKFCNVKNIFFPLTEKADTEISLVDSFVNETKLSKFTKEFIKSPRTAINEFYQGNEIQLFSIKPYNKDVTDKTENNTQVISRYSGEDLAKDIFKCSSISTNHIDWVFIPYNFELTNRKQELEELLAANLSSFCSLDQLQTLWEENKNDAQKKIKKAYENLKGSHNPNSMTLYSGTKEMQGYQYFSNNCYCKYCYKKRHYKVGCLYTGDYDASKYITFDELRANYHLYWQNIGCVQIPHHGSKYNYNSEFANMHAFFLISARTNSSHPHPYVVNDLRLNDHNPLIVTEKIDSAVSFIVEVFR